MYIYIYTHGLVDEKLQNWGDFGQGQMLGSSPKPRGSFFSSVAAGKVISYGAPSHVM